MARGRRSAEAAALVPHIVPVVPQQRPDPPGYLNAAEKREWRAYVGRMPPTWFGSETYPMLADLCRAVVLSRYFGSQLNEVIGGLPGLEARLRAANGGLEDKEFLVAMDLYLARMAEFAKLQLEQSKHIKTLSTALRLTPQSKYTPETAALRTRSPAEVAPKRRLWET
jgi:hypothetical protein